jgi:lipopolysaccharide export LptBFGC system permease protein LptF
MRLSDRYIFSDLWMPFFIGTFLVLMMIVGNTLYAWLDTITREKWPLDQVARMLVLNIPTATVLTLPVSTALAASLAINRMARDNEITVLRGSGVPLYRIFLPIVAFGALISLVNLYIANRVTPWAFKEQQNVESVLNSITASKVEQGRTFSVDNYTVTFRSAAKVNQSRWRLNKVVIVENTPPPVFGATATSPPTAQDAYPLILTAASADYEKGANAGVWYLKSVVYHHYKDDGMTNFDLVADSGTLNLTIDFNQMYQQATQFDKLSYEELTQRAAAARRFGQSRDATTLEVERWFKLSLPLMGIVLALCGPPLALQFARAGAFTGILLSVITSFVAWNTLLLMKSIGYGGYLPPAVAAWSTNALFTLVGLWLLRIQE